MPAPVGVFLIDDSPPMREMTRFVIEEDDRLTVVGEAADVPASLELLQGLEADVILLDQSLPRLSGLDAIPLIREQAPGAAILLYTGHLLPGLEQEAIDKGAQGAIEKGGPIAEMREAIHSAADPRTHSQGGDSSGT